MILETWCKDWNIPSEAVSDLKNRMILAYKYEAPEAKGETAVQNRYRAQFSEVYRGILWRNNVGATFDERGNFIRYGLANESKRMNQAIKSADLIGIKPVQITQSHVGSVIGQFISREAKATGWTYKGNARETAQKAWADLIISLGGDAAFVKGENKNVSS